MRDYAPILPDNSDYLWERSGRAQRHCSSRSGSRRSRPPRNDDCAAVSTNCNIMPERCLPDAAKLIADVLDRTETAGLIELALRSQAAATRVSNPAVAR